MKYPYQKLNPKNEPSFFQTKGKMKRYTFKRSGDFYSLMLVQTLSSSRGCVRSIAAHAGDNEMLKLMALLP